MISRKPWIVRHGSAWQRARRRGSSCPTAKLLVLLLVVVAMVRPAGALDVTASPAPGASAPSELLAVLLQQADQAWQQQRWSLAQRCLRRALPLAPAEIAVSLRQRRTACAALQSFEARYLDGNLLAEAARTSAADARGRLAEVINLIESNYYCQTDPRALLARALDRMELNLTQADLPELLNCAPFATPGERRVFDRCREQLDAAGAVELRYCLAWVDDWQLLARERGLQDAWVALEWACVLAESLDEYSTCLTARQYADFRDALQSCYVGLGIDLIAEGDWPTVFDVVPGSGADEAGVEPGDVLYTVDGLSLFQLDLERVGRLLGGQPNSRATLGLRRTGREFTVSVSRRQLQAPTVRQAHCPPGAPTVGYLRISGFDQDTAQEVRRALDSLVPVASMGLIIDLRGNGGGLLNAAVDTAALFLDGGPVVSVRTAGRELRYTVGADCAVWKRPVVILVDHYTASAAEILAAALRDRRRAVLVGQPTFGKGVAQTVYPLRHGGGALRLTTSAFVPPSGRSFQDGGLLPDFATANIWQRRPERISMAGYLSPRDPALRQALALLENDHRPDCDTLQAPITLVDAL